jgi:hypothetical protein
MSQLTLSPLGWRGISEVSKQYGVPQTLERRLRMKEDGHASSLWEQKSKYVFNPEQESELVSHNVNMAHRLLFHRIINMVFEL